MKPVRVPSSASAISTTNTTGPMNGTFCGANPPPRNLTGRAVVSEVAVMSVIDQLQVCGHGFVAHEVPETALLLIEVGITVAAFGKRLVDLDDLADLPRTPRQHHDLVAEPHGL